MGDRGRPLALAARRQGAPAAEWVLLVLAAVFLLGGHPPPFGTLASGCFFAGALLLERRAGVERTRAPGRS